MTAVWVVTDQGLVHLSEKEGEWQAVLVHRDSSLQTLALDPYDRDTLYIGSRGHGVWKSRDGGETWADTKLPETDVFSLAVSPADGSVYAGCEPSRLFKSQDGAETWRELSALRQLPSAPTWSFPPRPWTSHVRSIAPHPKDAGLLLVGIELGGLMRSEDGGETWEDHRPGAQKDVHALAWHPRATDYAYEAGGGGAAWSEDRGQTWQAADDGRERHYCWGLAVADSERWYVSASPSARYAHSEGDARACIYRWRGEGPWEQLEGGLSQPLSSLPYALLSAERHLFAGLGDGRLYTSEDEGDSWRRLQVHGEPLVGLRQLIGA